MAVEEKTQTDSERKRKLTAQYRSVVETEMEKFCGDLLDLIDDKLIPTAKDESCEVFYLKMKGDYNRYLAEMFSKDSAKRKQAAENAECAYNAAWNISTESLSSVDPVRLGLVLNYSVFHYEISNNSEKACEMAKEAFDSGLSELEKENNSVNYNDTTAILQLLRDNLETWSSEEK